MDRQQEERAVPVIRTDFADDLAWEAVCAALRVPDPEFALVANVVCVNDPRYAGLTVDQLTTLVPKGPLQFMLVADQLALTHSEHPLLVVDLDDEPGRAFRAIPSEICLIEANLSIANMDFFEFADAVDSDGIFRGFARP
jgi:hypothetical protein